ncbi:Hydroxymethylpyrimidine/phosphomethylpyrimidine kinase [Commensalibacter sp. Nvir]|uniref:bifunctional hydroxymethylpyrimidine kinase/phosphomethylpyrimidine kinase n=1 Tax=Commensalibacter sp. Nvir TaxID=3069817 RepID=UPI002D298878|nr:Hydroxymethylpyrimidine/phosphomethylpyrimidine kinase [Commensalibacter sp. Nvir]
MIKNVLTIAGTDPSGGAGIQADIKTFSALGCYAMSVITSVVAQNTQGVISYKTMDPELIADQMDAVFEDIHVDAVKIGMLANELIVGVVAQKLKQYAVPLCVLDPVMVAKSGDSLINDDAIQAIKEQIVPHVTMVTPNLPEARVLLGKTSPISLHQMKESAEELLKLGPKWVLLKGGHLSGSVCLDVLTDAKHYYEFSAERVVTKNDHGTGCTLSSAITALLPNHSMYDSVLEAKRYLTEALKASDQLTVGTGHGPLNHFYQFWQSKHS